MRKIFALFALCLLLSGCHDVTPTVDPSSGDPAIPAENPPPEIHTPDASPMPSVSPLPRVEPHVLNTDFALDIELPEPINYAPEVKVFPLTSAWGKYTVGVQGSVTFVDEQLVPIDLPFKPIDYATIGAWGNNSLVAYALLLPADHPENNGWSWVLMLADGTVPRGKDGKYIQMRNYAHNIDEFALAGSAVVTYESITGSNHDEDGYPALEDYRYGLYDLEDQRELLPKEYEIANYLDDWFYFSGIPMFYACKDGQGFLFDSKGHILHEFGEVSGLSLRNAGYTWHSSDRVFSYHNPNGGLIDNRFDTVYINKDHLLAHRQWYGISVPNLFVVYDRSGKELFRTSERDDAWAAAGFTERAEWVDPRTEDEFYMHHAEDGPIYYEKATKKYVILDDTDNVLLRADGSLNLYRQFILNESYDSEDPMRTDPKAIYALDGSLLADNVYGWIDDIPAPGGGLFVYLDPETCVLLMPDGSMTPVPAAPKVEKVYWGG